MNILIRVDSSSKIGIGHVIRCIALAQQCNSKMNSIYFLSSNTMGNANNLIAGYGFRLIDIQSDLSESNDAEATLLIIRNYEIDTLIVDHYGLGSEWESLINPIVNLVVIDDFDENKHEAKLLINSGRKKSQSDAEYMLFGSDYCLIRKDFLDYKQRCVTKRANSTEIHKVLISYGGTDVKELTCKTVHMLRHSGFTGEIVLLVSSGISNLPKLKQLNNVEIHIDELNVAKILLDCDIAIGALGGSAWERCSMGLPSFSIQVADNQRNIASTLMENKAAFIFDNIDTQLPNLLKNAFTNPDFSWWKDMSKQCFRLCDGLGALRVATKVMEL